MSEDPSSQADSRYAAMVDVCEIKALPHRLARGLDRCDRALILSCFHEDGMDDHGFFRGTAGEFCDWAIETLRQFDRSQHLISTQNVELSGDVAFCESYFTAHLRTVGPGDAQDIVNAGRYLDTMEKRNGLVENQVQALRLRLESYRRRSAGPGDAGNRRPPLGRPLTERSLLRTVKMWRNRTS